MSEAADLLAAVREVSRRRLVIHNMFENRARGTWEANLRNNVEFWRFGIGPTPAAALRAALDMVNPGAGQGVIGEETRTLPDDSEPEITDAFA